MRVNDHWGREMRGDHLNQMAQEIWIAMAKHNITRLSVRVEGSCDSGAVDQSSVEGIKEQDDKIETLGYSDLESIPAVMMVSHSTWSNGGWTHHIDTQANSTLGEAFSMFADELASVSGANYNNEGCIGTVEAVLATYTMEVEIRHGKEVGTGEKDSDGYEITTFEYDDENADCHSYEFPPPEIIQMIHEVEKAGVI